MSFNRKEIEERIEEVYHSYAGLAETDAALILGPDTWSVKEIFGHLIDSAANNYQRFIRLQESERLDFPGYDYNWIKIVPYNTLPYDLIIKLWREFNLLLTHIIENIDVTALDHVWTMAGKELSLEFLVADYYRHLEEHLDQLKRRHRDVVKARKE